MFSNSFVYSSYLYRYRYVLDRILQSALVRVLSFRGVVGYYDLYLRSGLPLSLFSFLVRISVVFGAFVPYRFYGHLYLGHGVFSSLSLSTDDYLYLLYLVVYNGF